VAYLKPPWFTARVFNRLAMVFGMGETLTVTTRRSKRPQRIPVIPVDVAGKMYVVSTRGESEWVKNLRADPSAMIGNVEYVAREISEHERRDVLEAYRQKAGRSVEGYFRKLPHEADHPVFVLTPRADHYTL
jgi:F420H(2)-dependent quinone reductase